MVIIRKITIVDTLTIHKTLITNTFKFISNTIETSTVLV